MSTTVMNAVKINHCLLNKNSLAGVAGVIVHDFLERMHYTRPQYCRDSELEQRVKEITRRWNTESDIHPYIITALVIAETGYTHLNVDHRLAITLFTAIATSLDDPRITDTINTYDFARRMCDGSLQRDSGLLGEMHKVLMKMWDLYAPYAANAIISNTLQFCNGFFLENKSGDAPLHPQASGFLAYRRSMTGISEAYACFIWDKDRFPNERIYAQAIPDAMVYIGYANDILSFYKEELDGETATYIHDRAYVSGKPPLDTLRDVVDETVAASDRVRAILGEGEARDAWDNFTQGYITFHVGDPRYRLQELLGGQYMFSDAEY